MSIILIILSQINWGFNFLRLKKLILVVYMLSREFIFSEKRSDRIKRHLLFWIFWWLYFGVMHAVQPFNPQLSYFQKLPYTILESILLMLPQFLLVYPLLYFVLPRYLLNNKYVSGFLWIAIFVVFASFVNYMMIEHVNTQLLSIVLPEKYLPTIVRPKAINLAMGTIGGMKGNITTAAIALGIKYIKHWYLKEQRNLQLQKENTEAQLQLLTARVHPHFLFNTLNNIYSKAQNESPGSAKMIMELSHILRFVLDEGKHALVSLDSELQMLSDYINLEKTRYDDKLDLHVSMPSKNENIYIAPLLLLPFIENCFKHGASKMLKNPWINLKIELKNISLFMKIMNGKKSSVKPGNGRKGTGIENVRKRLDLLYKDNYTLQVNEDEEVFVVNLTIQLVKIDPSVIPETKHSTTYA